jgi:hypothetical protein
MILLVKSDYHMIINVIGIHHQRIVTGNYPPVNSQFDPENHQFLVETHLPTPKNYPIGSNPGLFRRNSFMVF